MKNLIMITNNALTNPVRCFIIDNSNMSVNDIINTFYKDHDKNKNDQIQIIKNIDDSNIYNLITQQKG